MGDVESKLGSIGKTKEELSGVQVENLPELFLSYVTVWLFLFLFFFTKQSYNASYIILLLHNDFHFSKSDMTKDWGQNKISRFLRFTWNSGGAQKIKGRWRQCKKEQYSIIAQKESGHVKICTLYVIESTCYLWTNGYSTIKWNPRHVKPASTSLTVT